MCVCVCVCASVYVSVSRSQASRRWVCLTHIYKTVMIKAIVNIYIYREASLFSINITKTEINV